MIHAIRLLKDPRNTKALCGDILARIHGAKPRSALGLDTISEYINAILINHAISGHGGTPSLPMFQNGSTIIAWINLDHIADNFKEALSKSGLKRDEEVFTAVQGLMEATANRDIASYRECIIFLSLYEEALEVQNPGKFMDTIRTTETARKD